VERGASAEIAAGASRLSEATYPSLRCFHHSLPRSVFQFASSFVERERGRELAVGFNVLLQRDDLLLHSADRIRTGDEAARRWQLARDRDDRARELGRTLEDPRLLNANWKALAPSDG
jgi:hypothetical protein